MKTIKELYEGSVWQWMKYLVKHWFTYPSKRGFQEFLRDLVTGIVWLLLILTLPISAPILAIIGRHIYRKQHKVEYEKKYGESNNE